MYNLKKEKLRMILGSLFVIVIFLSAYAAFGNPSLAPNNANNSSNASSSNTSQIFFVSGNVNGSVVGYLNNIVLSLNFNKTDSVNYTTELSGIVSNAISSMQASNEISEYTPLSINDTSYSILLSNMSAYEFQQGLRNMVSNALSSKNIKLSNNISMSSIINSIIIVNATTRINLPPKITLNYSTQAVQVTPPSQNISMSIEPLLPIGTNVPLHIIAGVNQNGRISNSQFRVSEINS